MLIKQSQQIKAENIIVIKLINVRVMNIKKMKNTDEKQE